MLQLTVHALAFTSPSKESDHESQEASQGRRTIVFRNEEYQWHQVCEATYDNYMIRRVRA
jgi:hypothetical protein